MIPLGFATKSRKYFLNRALRGFFFTARCGIIVHNMVRDILKNKVRSVVCALYGDNFAGAVMVERSEEFGDYVSNAALVLAKQVGKSPREVAEEIKKEILKTATGKYIKSIDVAGPGFINITITDEALLSRLGVLDDVLSSGIDALSGEKINVEFISANPTGDLHIGHGRGAFFGDVLSNILRFAGADVTREFYINDSRESKQIEELGKTALGVGEQYKTPKVEKMIEEMEFVGFDPQTAGFALAQKIQAYNRRFIEEKLRIAFDIWYSEDEHIRATGRADEALRVLKEKGALYEKDGAVWIETSTYGDDEDRVVVRSDGTKSYFISDIAYHMDKFERGYGKVVDVWGADHHGHVKRMHAVGKILGWPQEPEPQPIIFITQLVMLKEAGERKKMSKRAGNVVLLEDLVDEIGIDVVRWFFLEKAISTHMDFDMTLAKERSQKNPVYYVQYAHARICSIEEKLKGVAAGAVKLPDVIGNESYRALAMKAASFTEVVEDIARDYQVHKLTSYAYELAAQFNQFYRDVRIIDGDTYNPAALHLVRVTKKTLAKALGLLGVSAPQRM